MNACSLLLVAAALGVDTGWQPLDDGSSEFIIQIEPELISSLKAGESITSKLPEKLQTVRSYRIVVGNKPLPRVEPPVDTLAQYSTNLQQTQYTQNQTYDNRYGNRGTLPVSQPTYPRQSPYQSTTAGSVLQELTQQPGRTNSAWSNASDNMNRSQTPTYSNTYTNSNPNTYTNNPLPSKLGDRYSSQGPTQFNNPSQFPNSSQPPLVDARSNFSNSTPSYEDQGPYLPPVANRQPANEPGLFTPRGTSVSKNGDLFNPTAGSVNNTSLSNTNPPGAALNDPRFGTQFPDRSSSDDRWLPFLFTAALLAGSVAGNFYMGWLWLATRRRFYSLVRERRIAS